MAVTPPTPDRRQGDRQDHHDRPPSASLTGWPAPPANDRRGERVDLTEVWLLLRTNWRTISVIAGLTLAVVVFATLGARMKFKARGSLYLGELQNSGAAQSTVPDQLDFMGGGNGDIGTEIEILKSQDLVKRAVLTSGLNVAIAPAGWSAPRYWHWRLAGRDLGLLDLGSRQLVATRATLAEGATGSARDFTVRFLTGGTYEIWTATQRLGTGKLRTLFKTADLEVTLAPGPEGSPAAGSLYTMTVNPIDEVVEEFARMVNVTVPKPTGPTDPVKVVAIDFVHGSPRAAAAFVATLMQEYLERRQSWKSEEARVTETFVIGQVGSIKTALDEAESKLADYRKSSNVVALGDESKGMIEQIGKYEQQRVAAQLQVATFGQIQGLLNKPNAPIEQYLVGETDDPVLASLSTNLALAQQELRRTQERFTPDAPAAREQQAQVNGQLLMVKNYVLGRFTRAQRQLESLNHMIGQFEQKLRTVPGAELDLAQLTRNADVLGKMYAFLLDRQQQAALTKASTISRNRILDSPRTPYREDSPAGGMRIVIGVMLGLLLGTLFVIMRRMLAPTYQTDRELRRTLADLPIVVPILTAIPKDTAKALGVGSPGVVAGDSGAAVRRTLPWLITKQRSRPVGSFVSDPRSAFSEAFRHLRTNIYHAGGAAAEDKVVLITSPSPGDGKTLTTLALAASLAADDKRVLVIEADMHKPSDQALFTQPHPAGLSSVLGRRHEWRDAIRSIRTPLGSFNAIAAGPIPPSPAELLSGPQFAALLADARRIYDFILIDSPPYPVVSDALIISMHVDRVLTVLRPRNTHRHLTEEHLRRLSVVNARYGVVINDADVMSPAAAYGYSEADRLRDIIRSRAETAR